MSAPPSESSPPTSAAQQAARPSAAVAATALGLLLGLQPLTTDLYLPAFPALTRDLGAPMHLAQLTMSALLLAFGAAQLVWGPLADRWGRRPVLQAGLLLYILASLGAMLALDMHALVAARIVQGLGLAAAVVVARATVRDLYEPHEGAHVMSLALSGLGLIAISSPVIGGFVAQQFGWRGTFAFIGLSTLAIAVFVWLKLPETVPQRNLRALHPPTLAANWRRILVHPTFLAWSSLTACTYGALFIFLAGSSFVYIDTLGLSPTLYGLVLGSSSISYLIGTFVCRSWLVRLGMTGTIGRASYFTLAGGLSMGALSLAGVQAIWAIALPQMAIAFGHGMHQSCGQAGAVGPFRDQAGTAAALAGCLLATVAFGIGRWLGWAMDGTARPMALGIAFWATLTAVVGWTLVRRHGAPGSALPAGAAASRG
ncbi:multidrug effflux MFS transporter [Sphaerotilus microaerophilus]|jgi:DHA1 family bicyclomycin/chloramphenicol resistance-like MFS transporter|uniref:Bcr/CflA family efflux transporter n=1 Tax=Sphaerotilus microaerophilus TaxID=2914710 RepID=A0ABM7YRZ6_9BURK|nr:multidrug effflux MFS transporter [Sphaerotilus sp. FB-5]BDI07328.1 Bcr/CflA family drug resistance efflux transporter [Sphaerotilus sp. FB-5]